MALLVKQAEATPWVMLDIPSQYMHCCLVLLCYCVRNRDHCCVLCGVARDSLLTWYIVHQPTPLILAVVAPIQVFSKRSRIVLKYVKVTEWKNEKIACTYL